MSHCTEYKFAYTEERILIKTFAALKIDIEYQAIGEYSIFTKPLALLGYAGSKQYRSISGVINGIRFYMKEEDDVFTLNIETLDQKISRRIETQIRQAYTNQCIESVLEKWHKKGISCKHTIDGECIDIELNNNITIKVVVSNENITYQEVSGAQGDLCTVLTEEIEELLAAPDQNISYSWKPEYNSELCTENAKVYNYIIE